MQLNRYNSEQEADYIDRIISTPQTLFMKFHAHIPRPVMNMAYGLMAQRHYLPYATQH
jgi:hypothetical protein